MSQLFLYFWENSEDVSAVLICLGEFWGCLSCFYIFGRVLGMSQLFLYVWKSPGGVSIVSIFFKNPGDVSAVSIVLAEF